MISHLEWLLCCCLQGWLGHVIDDQSAGWIFRRGGLKQTEAKTERLSQRGDTVVQQHTV